MDKDERKKIVATSEDEVKNRETIIKALSRGVEVEISIDGKPTKVYWEKTGHADRTYHKAYLKKKLTEAYEAGILTKKSDKETAVAKTPQRIFALEYISVIPESVIVSDENGVIPQDTYQYHSDLAVLAFKKEGTGNFEISYDYYDEDDYRDFVNIFTTCMMIFLAVRKVDNHNKKVFKTLSDVETLTLENRNDIVDVYMKAIDVTEEDLISLASPSSSEGDEPSQKSTT